MTQDELNKYKNTFIKPTDTWADFLNIAIGYFDKNKKQIKNVSNLPEDQKKELVRAFVRRKLNSDYNKEANSDKQARYFEYELDYNGYKYYCLSITESEPGRLVTVFKAQNPGKLNQLGSCNCKQIGSGNLEECLVNIVYHTCEAYDKVNKLKDRFRVHKAGDSELDVTSILKDKNKIKNEDCRGAIVTMINRIVALRKSVNSLIDSSKNLRNELSDYSDVLEPDRLKPLQTTAKQVTKDLKEAYNNYKRTLANQWNQSYVNKNLKTNESPSKYVNLDKMLAFYQFNQETLNYIENFTKISPDKISNWGSKTFKNYLKNIDGLKEMMDQLRTVRDNLRNENFSMSSLMARVARVNNFACTGRWFCPECGKEMKSSKHCDYCGANC